MKAKRFLSMIVAASVTVTSLCAASFGAVSASAAEEFPSRYSSVEEGWVTPIKDQSLSGTCWAHAVIAACESSLIKKNGLPNTIDLSELHLTYSAYHQQHDSLGLFDGKEYLSSEFNYINKGGNTDPASVTLANWNGVLAEETNHGQFASDKLTMENIYLFDILNTEIMYAFDAAKLTDYHEINFTDTDKIKRYIMEYGTGAIEGIASSAINYDHNTIFAPADGEYQVDHSVAVVGWDDNYPKENCEIDGQIPENDGAWLIKNSWGTDEVNEGYYWLSYEDYFISHNSVYFYDFDIDNTYTYSYGYDDKAGSDIFMMDDIGPSARMANIYTAQGTNETLKAVSFYTTSENTSYEISVYTGLTQNKTPVEGEARETVSGTTPTIGFHTVKLDSEIPLQPGERFSIVVRITNEDPDSDAGLVIDFGDRDFESEEEFLNLNENYSVKISDYGESFYSLDDSTWSDLKDYEDANFRIKALTKADEPQIEERDTYSSFEGMSREEIIADFTELIDQARDIAETLFIYSEVDLTKLMHFAWYGEGMIKNQDIFLASDFYATAQKIRELMQIIRPYDFTERFEDDFKYISRHLAGVETLDSYKALFDTVEQIRKISIEGGINRDNVEDYTYLIRGRILDLYKESTEKGAADSLIQLKGDANGDGEININDVTEIQKYLANMIDENTAIYYNASVDDDYELTIDDATEIQRFLCDSIDHFECYDFDFYCDDDYTLDSTDEEINSYLNNMVESAREKLSEPNMFSSLTEVRNYSVLKKCEAVAAEPGKYRKAIKLYLTRNLWSVAYTPDSRLV